jgi:hypothetical protein
MLDLRTVRLAVGSSLSLVFSQIREGIQADPNDGYDQWHVVQAAAADVFLTRDKLLATRLQRILVEGFRVVSTLRELRPDPAEAGLPLT